MTTTTFINGTTLTDADWFNDVDAITYDVLDSATTKANARIALELGDSATRNVGTAVGTVAAGSHEHASLYQPLDAQLTDVAGLTPTDNGVIIGNGTNFVVESGATLKTSLGLTIGTNIQAYSANLDEYAAVNPTTAGLALLDDADAAAQRTTLGLAIGTNVQAYSANLDEYAAVNPTTAGLALLDDADAAAQRTTLGLGTAAVKNTGTTDTDIPVFDSGRLYGTAIHNNVNAVTGTTNQYIASGTYTPTITNLANIAASTARECYWIRVGNVVMVGGSLNLDVTTGTTTTTFAATLPIASALTSNTQLSGICRAYSAQTDGMLTAQADTTNDRAQFTGLSNATTSVLEYHFTFTYIIL